MSEIINTFGVDFRLLIIQAINFGLLLSVLWYFLYRPLSKMLDERRGKIEEGVDNALKAEEKLSQIEGERESIIKDATQQAGILVEQGKHRGEEKMGEIVKSAQDKSEQIVHDAKAHAEESKRQALEESKAEIAKMAMLSAEKILKENTRSL
jgi:F-type H+-transporting ATPase subunit b